VQVVYRRAGDCNLLASTARWCSTYGCAPRARADALARAEQAARHRRFTPGVRSLQIHFDPHALSSQLLLSALESAERELASIGRRRGADPHRAPAAVVGRSANAAAIQKYTTSVRPDAPWCPSNIEFIRRINGLGSVDDVHRTVFGASYLVLGLGDVTWARRSRRPSIRGTGW